MLEIASTFSKTSITDRILPLFFGVSLALSIVPTGYAASPSLGAAATYGVLGSTYTNTTAGTTINGDVGFSTGPAIAPAGVHVNYGAGSPYSAAGIDQGSALSSLASQACTFNFPPGAINLSTETTHGPVGIYTPGVYCSAGAMDIGGSLTLNGNGTYIFRPNGALTSTVGAAVTLIGASPCDVFWTPTQATTLAANTTFIGTVIDDAGITVGANTTWTGMALSFGGTVTTDAVTITVSCPLQAAPAPSGNGGLSRRPMISLTKAAQPTVLPGPGSVTYTYEVSNPGRYTMNAVTLTDDKCGPVHYASGDVNNDALLQTSEIWTYRCMAFLAHDTFNIATVTGFANNLPATDIADATVRVGTQLPPPLIHVVKFPDISLLPFGGGAVTYTYTVTNPGTVALHYIHLIDDKCGAMQYDSGDTNDNSILEQSETWTYTCRARLSATTTNTVVATGNANNATASGSALATVRVAAPPAVEPAEVTYVSELYPPDPPPPPIATPEVPQLPNAGIAPEATDIPFLISASGLFIALGFTLSSQKAKRVLSSKY